MGPSDVHTCAFRCLMISCQLYSKWAVLALLCNVQAVAAGQGPDCEGLDTIPELLVPWGVYNTAVIFNFCVVTEIK